jgi:uncharacterized membrane protein
MLLNIKLYFIAFFSFIIADSIWIGFVMKKFYLDQMVDIGRISEGRLTPVYWSAAAVYVVLAIGVVEFVLPKTGLDSNWITTFLTGALMGLVIYGTYDFTNHATLKEWSLTLTLTDAVWGMFLTGIVSCITRSVGMLIAAKSLE